MPGQVILCLVTASAPGQHLAGQRSTASHRGSAAPFSTVNRSGTKCTAATCSKLCSFAVRPSARQPFRIASRTAAFLHSTFMSCWRPLHGAATGSAVGTHGATQRKTNGVLTG